MDNKVQNIPFSTCVFAIFVLNKRRVECFLEIQFYLVSELIYDVITFLSPSIIIKILFQSFDSMD